MKIIGIDPGPTKSGMVIWNDKYIYRSYDQIDNESVVAGLGDKMFDKHTLAIEMVASYGMPVGASVFDTCVWIGEFIREFRRFGRPFKKVFFRDVKMHFCHTMKAKEANVRQQVIDLHGGKDVAIGGKKCPHCKGKGWFGAGRPVCPECEGGKWLHPPGVFVNVRGHAWSALAVALYVERTFGNENVEG